MSERENCRWIKHRKCEHSNTKSLIIGGEKAKDVRAVCDLCLKAYTAESLHEINVGLEQGRFIIMTK